MSFKQLLEKSSKEVRFEKIEIKTVEESWLYLSMNDSSAVKQFPQSLLIFLSPQRSVKPWTLRTQSSSWLKFASRWEELGYLELEQKPKRMFRAGNLWLKYQRSNVSR